MRESPGVVRILVVDDYEPFRRVVCATLEARPELQVIGEASDGLQAVQKAEELQPDLILLDIGMPTLNGIEAAHRISRLVPAAKILFVSQDNDTDVVAAALSDGAKGYLPKQNANTELLFAVEAVSRGDRFVSGELISETKPFLSLGLK
jgi:DNA-binding NarL/FixJ family response regulator